MDDACQKNPLAVHQSVTFLKSASLSARTDKTTTTRSGKELHTLEQDLRDRVTVPLRRAMNSVSKTLQCINLYMCMCIFAPALSACVPVCFDVCVCMFLMHIDCSCFRGGKVESFLEWKNRMSKSIES